MKRPMIYKNLLVSVLLILIAVSVISCKSIITVKNNTEYLVEVLDEDGEVVDTVEPGKTKKVEVHDGYAHHLVPK